MISASKTARNIRHICLIAPSMNGGGAERTIIALCKALSKERKCRVDLVLLERRGALLPLIPDRVRLFILKHELHCPIWKAPSLKTKILNKIGRYFNLLWGDYSRYRKRLIFVTELNPLLIKRTADYIDAEKPDVVLGFMPPAFITALLARKSADYKPPVISSVHSSIESSYGYCKSHVVKLLPESDLVHGVSKNLVRSLPKIGVAEEKLVTIYNPVWGESLVERKRQPLDHPWLKRKDGAKTIISAGRLELVKDHDTLLQAFRFLAEKRKVRLILLGEGDRRRALEILIRELEIQEQVLLPGFVENPLPWFARSDLFVLSSLTEGLPTVLIEALACGCPVVSTDCSGGTREILQDGRFGKLTPVGNPEKLAEAMQATLDNPPDPDELINRAKFFSEERAITQYKKMLGIPA